MTRNVALPESPPTASVVWLSCGGCEGCTMAVLGAIGPRLEELLSGHLTHIPRVQLVHPALALDAGEAYLADLDRAAAGEFDPCLLVVEGSMFDESKAGSGSFSGLGERNGRRLTVEEWVHRLAPAASAVIAIGTCATWGGVPAAAGNVTGAHGLGDLLGADFRSASRLPLINVPGCAPSGDAFIELVSYTLLHLGGIVPLDLDEHGRPQWLYADSNPLRKVRWPDGSQEAADTAVAECPVPRRGWINHLGGCAAVSTGIFDEPDSYDARYATADDWGRRRHVTPGAVIDGELRTTRLTQINLGTEEFVDHSYYEHWTDGADGSTAPDGSPLSPFHPWTKRTVPRPEGRDWKSRYSWATSPRWDRQPMESGPLARHWITATAGLVESEFIRAGGGRIEISIPRGSLPETTLTWTRPQVVNALERNRARAVHVGYCLMSAYTFVLRALDLVRDGETTMAAPYEPGDGTGVGFWEAGRGTLTHYSSIEDGRLRNYQILTPSTWMASPRDPWDVPGPYEEAIVQTPLLEEIDDRDDFVGIDILRAIRSFDPCLPCAVHLHSGAGTVIRDATTCACGAG